MIAIVAWLGIVVGALLTPESTPDRSAPTGARWIEDAHGSARLVWNHASCDAEHVGVVVEIDGLPHVCTDGGTMWTYDRAEWIK